MLCSLYIGKIYYKKNLPHICRYGNLWWLNGKESACQCKRCRRCGFRFGSGRSPGEGNSYPLLVTGKFHCLENAKDRGTCLATVHGVTKESDMTEQTEQQKSIWEKMRVGLHLTNSVAKLVIITSTRCTTEDEMAGWHHWLDGHEFGWTPGVGDGQGDLVCCGSWGRKELDTTEGLNWTELNWKEKNICWKRIVQLHEVNFIEVPSTFPKVAWTPFFSVGAPYL